MHPTKRIEVEPLSEARWAKIEGSIFEQLDSERERERLATDPAPRGIGAPAARTWRWRSAAALIMAGAMAAAVGALATRSLWVGPPPIGSVPSRFVTSSSDSHIALGDSDVDIAPDSAVVVSGDEQRGLLLVLDRGKIDCRVAPRAGRPPFVVQAGDVRVRVVGTHFSVERDAQGAGAHVLVAAGIVEVTARGETATVGAGEVWPSAPKTTTAPWSAPAEASAAHAATKSDEALVVAPPRRGTTGGSRAHPARAARSASAVAAPPSVAPPPPQSAPVSAPLSAPPPAASPARPVAPPSAAAPTFALSPIPPPSVIEPAVAAPRPSVVAPPATAQELYETAARMERQNPEEALVLYRRVASGGGAWAANALYAAGRLQADRGHRADARRLLDEYLARFPSGPNAGDAKDLLERMR